MYVESINMVQTNLFAGQKWRRTCSGWMCGHRGYTWNELGDWDWRMCTAAQSLQSCPTLCDPMDCSPPGSSAHGIFQSRVLEWGATAFSGLALLLLLLSRFSCVRLCATAWTAAHQAPLSLGLALGGCKAKIQLWICLLPKPVLIYFPCWFPRPAGGTVFIV